MFLQMGSIPDSLPERYRLCSDFVIGFRGDDMQTMNVAAAILALTLVTAFADEATPAANWVPNSTVPLVQLTGEKFQYSAYNYYFKTDTPGTTLSNAGLYGAD